MIENDLHLFKGDRMSSNKKSIPLTLILSVIALGINYVISLVLTPYISDTLGTEAYGFVTLAKTIANYGIILTSCLNSFSSRFITIAYQKKEKNKANTFYSSVIIANIILLFATLIFSLVFVTNIRLFIVVPDELIADVKILFFLDFINYIVLAIGNIFTVYAYIKDKLYITHIIRIAAYGTEAVILLILFKYSDPHVYYVGISLLLSSGVLLILNAYAKRRELPEVIFSPKNYSFSAIRTLLISGFWNAVNNIGNLLNSGLDLWISNRMLSAFSMGQLSIVKTVSTIFTTLAQIVSAPFQPRLLQKYSCNDYEGVVNVLKKQIVFSGFVTSVICSGFISLGESYYFLWTPNQNVNLLQTISIITVIGFWFEGIATPLFFVYTLTLKNLVPCVITVISGILNVIGMYVLLKYSELGLLAVVGTTSVLGFFTYFVFNPIYASRCLHVSVGTFYPSILKVFFASVIVLAVSHVLSLILHPDTWLGLIFSAITVFIIAVPIHYIITTTKNEKTDIKIMFKRIIK